MTVQYLSISEIAQRLDLAPGTIKGYYKAGYLPEPDVKVGRVNGWKPETIDEWNANRPGRGHRTDLEEWKRK